jgi:zinc protease
VDGKRLSASQIAQQAEALGSSLSSATDWRGSALTMTVATPKLAEAAAADRGQHPVPDPGRQRAGPPEAADRRRPEAQPVRPDGPGRPDRAPGLVGRSVFGGSVTPASLARISRKDVQDFARQQLRPSWPPWW